MAGAQAAIDALVALLNAGSGQATGKIEIYDLTAGAPADPDDAIVGTLLGTLLLTNPAFNAAAPDTQKAVAAADTISNEDAAVADGTADWFRAYDRDGNAVIDGDVGTTTQALVLDDDTIVTNNIIAVSSWNVELPQA